MITCCRRECSPQTAARRGIVIALVAVCLIVLLGMLSLALDVGWMVNTKDQLQNAADAAALAAAMDLGQSNAQTTARNTAKTYLNMMRAGDQIADVDPNSTDISFGTSTLNPVTETWTYQALPPGTTGVDSVSVTARRSTLGTTAISGPLPLFFAGVLGRTQADINATAVAQLTARDIAVALDVSGSMVFDSSFVRFDTHLSDGGSGLVPGITINNADVYYAYSGNATTNHIQTRMEATGVMYSGSPVGATGYSVYAPPANGLVSSPYSAFASNNQGMKVGIIGTSVLPYGNGTVTGVYDPQTDPGLVFIPMGTFSFDSKNNQTGVPAADQVSSNTANTGLHATSSDDSTNAPGNLWGIVIAPNVNPAWGNLDPNQGAVTGVEADLRTRRGYSVEEIYCLRNPQDPDYTTLAPRNPQYATSSANVTAAATAQEGATTSRWQLRSMIILDMAKWDSGLLNPLWSLPPSTPPSSADLLSSTSGSAFTTASWQSEMENPSNPSSGNMSIRISRAAGGITSYMDLPQGKRYVAGNQPEWAFYEISGEDGFRSGSAYDDWSNCITVYSTGTPTKGNFTLTANVSGTNRTTASITWNATSTAVQTALGNLTGVGSGNILCYGGPVNTAPVGVYFNFNNVTVNNLTCTSSGYNTGAAANVLFNQSYDDYSGQHGSNTYTIKTAATMGTASDWRNGGAAYSGNNTISGVAYYDAFNNGSYVPGYRLAKAWSLTRLSGNSTPSAPQSGNSSWKWLVAPHAFNTDALYHYHFWETNGLSGPPTTATGDNKWWDSGEVSWPGTGSSLDGRSGSGFISGNYSSGTPGKLSEQIILGDLANSTSLNTYFNWVAGPRNTAYWSYPGRSRLLQSRFGAKTLTETELIIQQTILQSKYQFQLPMLPFQAGRDALFAFAQYEYGMALNQDYYAQDFLSMAIFGQDSATNALVVPLTTTYDQIWNQYDLSPNSFSTQQNGQNSANSNIIPCMCLQPVMWSGATCIGGGLRRAFEAIDKQYSANSLRQNSKATIILVTDGRTNIWYQRSDLTNPTSNSSFNTTNTTSVGGRQSLPNVVNGVEIYDGPSWTIDANGNLVSNPPAANPVNWNAYNGWYTTAMQNNPYGTAVASGAANSADLVTREDVWYLAKQQNVTFHVILIGADADPFLGNWIASVSGGLCIWANGGPAQYIPVLQAAFKNLAAYKPVSLIQ